MTINTYVKKWCDEDYKVEKEDFYASNAEYVAERSWVFGGLKHGIFAMLIALVFCFVNGEFDPLQTMLILGSMSLCFWFFGIRNYGANDLATGAGIYLMLGIVLIIANFKVTDLHKWIFAIPTFALFFYLSIFKPIAFIKIAYNMKKMVQEEEAEEDESAKGTYKGWEAGYRAYRYELPEPEKVAEDPLLAEVWKLFDGYKDNKQILKARYRKLAKIHHPDVGGDTRMFQRIVYVYEELLKDME